MSVSDFVQVGRQYSAFRFLEEGAAFSLGYVNPTSEALGARVSFASTHPLAWSLVKAEYTKGAAKGVGSGLWKATKYSAGPAIIPILAAVDAYQGYKEGGFSGAIGNIASSVVVSGMFQHFFRMTPASTARGIASIGKYAARAGTLALPVMATYGVASFATSQATKSAVYKHSKMPLELAGSLASFQTRGAMTMRQRSIQAIQKSHLNARSAFGQEASWAHISGYRGR